MPPKLGDHHQIMGDHRVRHVPFVQDLVEPQQFISVMPRPRRMICHPMCKFLVEGLCLRKPDPIMIGGIFKCVLHRLHKAGVIEDGIVISNFTKFDHVADKHVYKQPVRVNFGVQSNVMRSYWNRQLPISLIQ